MSKEFYFNQKVKVKETYHKGWLAGRSGYISRGHSPMGMELVYFLDGKTNGHLWEINRSDLDIHTDHE